MLIILEKSFYILLLLAVNLYVVIYINSKLIPRMELRRGPKMTKAGGISYPWVKFLSYLSKDSRINLWEIIIFLVSLSVWSMVPITPSLVLVDLDYSLVVVLFIYTFLLILNVINGETSFYTILSTRVLKRVGMLLSFLIPVLFSVSSVVLINKTLSLKNIVNFQYKYWNIVYQPLSFIVIFISILFQIKLLGITKKNRFLFSHNFDKEGKGLGKMFTRLSSYTAFFLLVVFLDIVYLGGWQNMYFVRGEIMLILKFYFMVVVFLLADKTLPNLDNYKYLNNINYRFLIPLSIINFGLTMGFLVYRNVFGFI